MEEHTTDPHASAQSLPSRQAAPEEPEKADEQEPVPQRDPSASPAPPAVTGGGPVRRLMSAWRRAVDRVDQRRRAERAWQLHYEESVGSRTGEAPGERAAGPAPSGAAHTADSPAPQAAAHSGLPPVIATRSTALASLPSWLVRGGLGAWLGLGIIIMIALVVYATSIIVPVFIGVFMALVFTSILQPLVSLFARVMPRYPATFLALLTTLAAIVGLMTYVVTSVTSQWASLTSQFSDGLDTIVDFVEHGPLPVHLTQQELAEQFQAWVRQGQDYLQSNAPTLATEVLSNASAVVDFFAVMALAIFSTIFFLASGGRMWRWFLDELPAHLRESVHRAAGAGWYTFAGYARGTVIVALADGVMAGIFLQLVGIPLAAPLAVLVFIGAFIPIIGAPAAMIIAMVVALASHGPLTMVVVGLGVAAIGQIEGHILQPLIMGRQVSLHPVVVIIGVAVGTYAAGLLGAIIAVPLIGVLWSVYSELHVKDAPVVGELPAYTARG
ncbi:AI-2E family transporter [Actinomyces slackii]|uniref:Pheromone autoinducer 2 transporter n=2 Tax=Actinomyces slackii TaxID=52774 RepID=A0A3S4SU40_9ACTO|nr:pheromone autoinducer 2 transporter [Actinomyces slackii]